MRFEWDAAKAVINERKHCVSFNEAAGLFRTGAFYLQYLDRSSSREQDRSVAIGPIARGIVTIVFVEREDDVVRLISARFATRREVRMYDASMSGAVP